MEYDALTGFAVDYLPDLFVEAPYNWDEIMGLICPIRSHITDESNNLTEELRHGV